MASHLQLLPAVSGGSGEAASAIFAIPSEIPAAIAKLSAKEKKVWEHVTASLLEAGLIHRTDAMALTVICRTFVRWVEAEEKLNDVVKEKGTYIVATPNGYEQPHQLFYVVRTLKKELLQWLPEAALTIPSFQKMVGERATPGQGSLFDEDPVEAHKTRKTAMGIRAV